MERVIKGIVRYDGTNFAGWQVQPNQRTVQGVLQEALATLAGRRVPVHGAGRTDAGVHALAQVFHFSWNGDQPIEDLRRSLSAMAGPDARVSSLTEAPDGFHARYSAVGKRYGYCFCVAREADPFSSRYAWRVPCHLELQRVESLAQRLTGRHDFAGFCASKSAVQNTYRTIHGIALHRGPIAGARGDAEHWHLVFHGDGFLYKMIRNITGTIVSIARGKLPEDRLAERLASSGPYEGYTAPAKGLFLLEVLYE